MSTVEPDQAASGHVNRRHPVAGDLGFRLGLAHRTLRAMWEREIAELGVTPPQAAVLRAVTEGEACGLRGLARRMGSDVMNVRRLAEHLERGGLVSIGQDPLHRQRRIVRPTADGVTVSEELARRAARRNRHLVELLGEDDLASLQDLLDRLQTALMGAGPSAQSPEGGTGGCAEHERDTR
jgi:DNA-binding MarR family transcriptional regulator